MRYLKVLLCFAVIVTLTACSSGRFMDLSGFVYNYNKVSAQSVELTDFFMYYEDKNDFSLLKDNILLTVCHNAGGSIEQCRIMMLKKDENGNTADISTDAKSFAAMFKNTLQSYCGFDLTTAEKITEEFSLSDLQTYLKEGELTKTQDRFYFVFYSDSLACQMSIYDTYLKEIESTKKPSVKL